MVLILRLMRREPFRAPPQERLSLAARRSPALRRAFRRRRGKPVLQERQPRRNRPRLAALASKRTGRRRCSALGYECAGDVFFRRRLAVEPRPRFRKTGGRRDPSFLAYIRAFPAKHDLGKIRS